MNLLQYLRDRLVFFLVETAATAFTAVFLSAFALAPHAVAFVVLVFVLGNTVVVLHDYMKRNAYYRDLIKTFDGLDQKYLISEMIEPAPFADGMILYDLLRGANKSMNDRIAAYRRMSADYREYLEAWVHEIKTPIASARLTAENNPSQAARKIDGDLLKIEGLVTQALYYARSNTVEKDYMIGVHTLQDLTDAAVRRNARELIENRIKIVEENLEVPVYTDEKWIGFILDQIIGNAVKYWKEGPCQVRFCGRRLPHGVELYVEDNGIGVPEKDLGRIFDKGFTGDNGRKYAKSTGMGLYICKKLCEKLGLSIFAQSPAPGGLRIAISFPKSDMYLMKK